MLRFEMSEELKNIYKALEDIVFELDVKVKFDDTIDGDGVAICRSIKRWVSLNDMCSYEFRIFDNNENEFSVTALGEEAIYHLSDGFLTSEEVIGTIKKFTLPKLVRGMVETHPMQIISCNPK